MMHATSADRSLCDRLTYASCELLKTYFLISSSALVRTENAILDNVNLNDVTVADSSILTS